LNWPIVAGNQVANIANPFAYVGTDPGGTVAKISAGNAQIVFSYDPSIGFNPTQSPEVDIEKVINEAPGIAYIRYNIRTGSYPSVQNAKFDSQVDFVQLLLDNTTSRNDTYKELFGTP
jgi:hypothetical protein